VHLDDRMRVEGAVAGVLAGLDDYEVEHRIAWPDGRERWVLARGHALREAQGQAIRVSGTMIDITARKREEWAHLLLAEAASGMTSLDAAECLRAAMRALVGRFADVAMAQAFEPGGGLLTEVAGSDHVPADLPGLIRDVWSRYPLRPSDPAWSRPSLLPSFGEDEVRRFTRSEEHLALLRRVRPLSSMIAPLHVRGTPVGALTITRIRDGITRFDDHDLLTSSELAHRVAARLDKRVALPRRAEKRSRGRAGGLGLGLYISRQIVAAHGGQIEVVSCAGQGTTFEVALPRQGSRERGNCG
jgi:hypothetical protein